MHLLVWSSLRFGDEEMGVQRSYVSMVGLQVAYAQS